MCVTVRAWPNFGTIQAGAFYTRKVLVMTWAENIAVKVSNDTTMHAVGDTLVVIVVLSLNKTAHLV